jgi:two-component system chemotaxis response regulator CheB
MTYGGLPEISEDDFKFFQKRVHELSGIHLTSSKMDLVRARLIARLTELNLPAISDYRRYLESLPSQHKEWQHLVNQITTNKTDFFREPAHFKYLTDTFLPEWEKKHRAGRLRVWSAASSSGEEPYTLAMVLDRYFAGEDRFEILASDIDTKVLALAQNAVYSNNRLHEIPMEYVEQAIVKGQREVKGWFKIRKRIADRVRFSRINLIESNFFGLGQIDIIFCRNVFIYFQPDTIQEIIRGFSQVLNKDGLLILGHSESVRLPPSIWSTQGPSVYRRRTGTQTAAKPAPVLARAPSLQQVPSGKKKVLIVDDSLTIRQLLSTVFSQSDRLQVVAAIGDPRDVESAIQKFRPDVITLDLKMPHLDGCQILEQILPKFPIPVVIISAVTREEGPLVLQALELGAVDYLQKPTLQDLKSSASNLIEVVCQAADAHVHRQNTAMLVDKTARKRSASPGNGKQVTVAIGSSTGGIQALTEVLTQLPDSIPPILIVQHIPSAFSRPFAERLNTLCAFQVKEAQDGDLVLNDQVLIAPGGRHMELESSVKGYRVRLTDAPAVNRHKPSVDVLFESVARLLGPQAIGVLLTGMGQDGAKGLKSMKDAGAITIAQDEASSAVYGMPREAVRLRAVDHVLPLDKIPQTLMRLLQDKKTAKSA